MARHADIGHVWLNGLGILIEVIAGGLCAGLASAIKGNRYEGVDRALLTRGNLEVDLMRELMLPQLLDPRPNGTELILNHLMREENQGLTPGW